MLSLSIYFKILFNKFIEKPKLIIISLTSKENKCYIYRMDASKKYELIKFNEGLQKSRERMAISSKNTIEAMKKFKNAVDKLFHQN